MKLPRKRVTNVYLFRAGSKKASKIKMNSKLPNSFGLKKRFMIAESLLKVSPGLGMEKVAKSLKNY